MIKGARNYGYSKYLDGVTTIEMAYLMPLVLGVIMALIYISFYFHDKYIMNGMAYETAVIGTQKDRLPEGIDEQELSSFFLNHMKKKLILFRKPQVFIDKEKEYIRVKAIATRRKMKLKVDMKILRIQPEINIRRIKK